MTRARTWVGSVLALLVVAVLAAALVFAVFPWQEDQARNDGATGKPATGTNGGAAEVLVIAHRGASAYAPHDTVAAAREAVDRGADVLEVDVRQTADGHLVALFSPTLAPTTDVEQVFPRRAPWRVESFTLREIRRLDAGSWFSPEFAGERVPTLREIEAAIDGSGLEIIVEPKSPKRYPGIADRLARELRRKAGSYQEVESFDWGFLRRFEAEHDPPVVLGLTGTPPLDRLDQFGSFAAAVNPGLSTVDAAYVDAAHAAGLEVKVWSVNEAAAMRRAIDMGVDGIYTHRPDLLRRVLDRQAG